MSLYRLSFIWTVAFESFCVWIVDKLEIYLPLVENERFMFDSGGDSRGGRVMKPLNIFTLITLRVCMSVWDSLLSLWYTSVFIIAAGQLKRAEQTDHCVITECVF